MFDPRLKKIALIMGGLLLFAIIAAIVINLLEPSRTVKIESIPEQVSVRVNDKNVKLRDSSLKLKKGEHVLVFSAEGYKNSTRSVNVSDDFSDTTLSVALEPIKPEAYRDSARNQVVLRASDEQSGGLLSFATAMVKTPDGDAVINRCKSLRYREASAVCVSSPSVSYGTDRLKSRLQSVYKNSLTQYEIYYGFNSMATIHEGDGLRVRYAYTIEDERPSLYIKTDLRNIDDIYTRLAEINIKKDDVYLSFEDSALTQYNSLRKGGVDNHGPHSEELYGS